MHQPQLQPETPHQDTPPQSIYAIIYNVIHTHPEERITVSSLIKALQEKGYGLLMMILVLPNCIPIPIPPGGSTVFSIPLLFLCVPMLLGRASPWLPLWLRQKTISRSFMLRLLHKIGPWLHKIESRIKPRFTFTATHAGEKLTGLFWLLFSISIAVPLPMTNFLPGIGILISAFGLLGNDGYAVLSGFFVGMVGVLLTTVILVTGSGAFLSLFM